MSQRCTCWEALQRAASKSKPNDLNNSNEDGIQPSDELPSQEETNRSMLFDQDFSADLPQLDGDNPSSSSQQACVEEVEDEEAGGSPRWVEDYPGNAGETKSQGQSYFECWREAQKENEYEPWAPFKDLEEWELAQWIMQSGLSQGATDKYLKLPIVSLITMWTIFNIS